MGGRLFFKDNAVVLFIFTKQKCATLRDQVHHASGRDGSRAERAAGAWTLSRGVCAAGDAPPAQEVNTSPCGGEAARGLGSGRRLCDVCRAGVYPTTRGVEWGASSVPRAGWISDSSPS